MSRSLATRRIVPRRPQIPGCDNAYCKYAVVHGDDWTHLDGPEDGISQITRKTSGDSDQKLVWNFPVEVTYKSTNAFGWPQLILSVYSIDALGRDVIRGYGCVHLPIAAGVSVRKVPLYKPLSASLMQQFMAWVSGRRPAEFSNPKFPAMGEGREVTRVQSTGYASVQLNVVTKDMAVFGYSEARKPRPGLRRELSSPSSRKTASLYTKTFDFPRYPRETLQTPALSMRVFQPITLHDGARRAERRRGRGRGRGRLLRAVVAASGSNGASLCAGSFDGDKGSVSFPSCDRGPPRALASSCDWATRASPRSRLRRRLRSRAASCVATASSARRTFISNDVTNVFISAF